MTTALKQKPEFVWQKTAPLTASNLKKRNQAITKELQEQGYMTNDQRVKTDTVVAQTGKVPLIYTLRRSVTTTQIIIISLSKKQTRRPQRQGPDLTFLRLTARMVTTKK
eukprot:499214_1